jgi:two-component system chemotaxis response regulator CheY
MKTCLVVDDSKVVRMVARKILEEPGFAFSEAEDGQVALDMSMQSMPDVVLLD